MIHALLPRIYNKLAVMDRSQSMKLHLDAPIASFTFDDFPTSAYTVAGRMLEEVGARATYFVSAEFMGRTIDGIEYYSPELVREAYAKGHEIGCHAFDHTYLGMKGAAFARDTADRNAAAMRGVLGEQCMLTSFAYPYGDVSPRVKWAMGKKFALCRGVQRTLNTGVADLAQLAVISLEMRHWDAQMLAATIAEAKRQKSWIVFLTHDISNMPTPYGSTPEMVQATLRALADAGIAILPLKAAAAQAIYAGSELAGK